MFAAQASAFGPSPQKMTDNRPDMASNLQAAFGGSCSSQGAFTAAAQAQNQQLQNAIIELKTSQACAPFVAQIEQMSQAAAQIQATQNSASYRQYQSDQNQIQILTLALQNPSLSSSDVAALSTQLQTTRGNLYSDQATYEAARQTTRSSLIANGANSVLSLGSSLVSTNSATDFRQCLQQSPSYMSLALGANLVAAGGSFLPTVYGAGLSAISSLVGIGAQMFSEAQYDSALTEAQWNMMPDALNCALESLTDSYCNVRDSLILTKLANANKNPNFTEMPLYQGIDILGHQLPSLIAWLQKIENGVPPQNAAQAIIQVGAINEELTVEESNISAIAGINTAIAQYNSYAANPNAANQEFLNGIASSALGLSGASSSGGGTSFSSSPFTQFQSNPVVWACWLINGYFPFTTFAAAGAKCLDPSAVIGSTLNGVPSQSQLVTYLNALTSNGAQVPQVVANINSNWASAESQVQTIVDEDFGRLVVTDSNGLIANANEALNGNPFKPREVLGNIQKFIDNMIVFSGQYGATNPSLLQYLETEKAKISAVTAQIDNAITGAPCPQPSSTLAHPNPFPNPSNGPAVLPFGPRISLAAADLAADPAPSPTPQPTSCMSQRLVQIYTILGLENGTQGFVQEIQDLVNTDLQNRFSASQIPSGVNDILETAGTDLYIRLSEVGLGDLQPITDDLVTAEGDYQSNIRSFREFYQDAFEKTLDRQWELAQNDNNPKEGPYRIQGQKFGRLCLLWFLSANIPGSKFDAGLNFPDDHVQKLCMNAAYYDANGKTDSNGNFTPVFAIRDLAQNMGSSSFQDRVCAYHDFKLHSLAQSLIAGSSSAPQPRQ